MLGRPVTWLLVISVCMVCIGSVAAIACHSDKQCREKVSGPPLFLLGVAACVIVCSTLFYAEAGSRGAAE